LQIVSYALGVCLFPQQPLDAWFQLRVHRGGCPTVDGGWVIIFASPALAGAHAQPVEAGFGWPSIGVQARGSAPDAGFRYDICQGDSLQFFLELPEFCSLECSRLVGIVACHFAIAAVGGGLEWVGPVLPVLSIAVVSATTLSAATPFVAAFCRRCFRFASPLPSVFPFCIATGLEGWPSSTCTQP
jgi:hypothetical protein